MLYPDRLFHDAYNDLIWLKPGKMRKDLTEEMLEPFKRFGMDERDVATLMRISRKKRLGRYDWMDVHLIRDSMVYLGEARTFIVAQLQRRIRALNTQPGDNRHAAPRRAIRAAPRPPL